MTKTTTKLKRNMVKIDEEKCNGCGLCIIKCAEGALKIIDGKARLISDKYCDGLGACLGECPQGAIIIEERYADAFDEAAVEHHLQHQKEEKTGETLACGCSSATVQQFDKGCACCAATETETHLESQLGHWPVQLTLVPPTAPFLKGADVALIADCVPFAYADTHQDFIRDHAVLVACPKLDDFNAHLDKLTQILQHAGINSLTVVHMEVPCCSGLVFMAKKAIAASGKDIALKEVTISARGKRLN